MLTVFRVPWEDYSHEAYSHCGRMPLRSRFALGSRCRLWNVVYRAPRSLDDGCSRHPHALRIHGAVRRGVGVVRSLLAVGVQKDRMATQVAQKRSTATKSRETGIPGNLPVFDAPHRRKLPKFRLFREMVGYLWFDVD
jgi:hypothetical protein